MAVVYPDVVEMSAGLCEDHWRVLKCRHRGEDKGGEVGTISRYA